MDNIQFDTLLDNNLVVPIIKKEETKTIKLQNIKNLINGILYHYYAKEQELLQKKPDTPINNYTYEFSYRYHKNYKNYENSEFYFLSNVNKLLILSSYLPRIDCVILIELFYMIYNENDESDDIKYEIFMDNYHWEIQEKHRGEIYNDENMNKLDNYDVNTWIYFMEMQYTEIDNTFSQLSPFEPNIIEKPHKRNFFSIKELIELNGFDFVSDRYVLK